ncbi:MAG: DUF4870 domain-containing protein [Sediminicola sp.]|tara:strand:- start:39577 stop:40050 length:474 start_codon:yes stop_codon:yes gene_type:complete
MTETLSKHERTLSAFIHASVFSKYFIPLGNFIFPVVLWTINKKEYPFVDHNGKQVLNFQLSMLLYSILLGLFSIPLFLGLFPNLLELDHFNFDSFKGINFHFDSDDFSFGRSWLPFGIAGMLHAALFIVNVVYTLLGTIRTHEGQTFKYPLSIPFIK